MKGFFPVYRKELYCFFSSPVLYVVAFIFTGLAGYFFYASVSYYSLASFQAARDPFVASQLNLSDMVLQPFFGSLGIVLLLMVPLITMRLFAEEKKTGTIELLFTYPISDSAAVLGKFFAAICVVLLLLVTTLPAMAVLAYVSSPPWGNVCSGYMGLFLMSCSFVSLGLFASSLTQNQIIAAALSFGPLLLLWIIGWAQSLTGPTLGSIIGYLSLVNHFDNFTKGIVDSRDALFYLLFTTLFIFTTLRILESRQWRG
ncbi:MAG: ABC transporter permease subunit [Deltaproteobacteria bacterium]|nr:ABC transporter permease subunit [Deltaproteobacteria bacterium]MBW2072655.1 ABC transporter permease subunit [Deltaproteobacteria bacterium]